MKRMQLLALLMALAIVLTCAPARASEADDRIESSFINSFVYKTYLTDDQITISSQDGVVTLKGTAVSDIHKRMAGDTAEALPGVKSVDNRIQLAEDHPDGRSDVWTSMKVKASLLYHRNVSGTQTEVEVNEGVVTLKGVASSQSQKDLATEYAKDVVGVKEVNNEMTVASSATDTPKTWTEAIDDASISAQVKGALMLNRSTSALKTGVATDDGVVTVSGKAKNAAEKALVAKLVEDIHGVKSVINNMTIAE